MKKAIKVLMLLPNLRVSNGVTSYAMNYYRKLNHESVIMDFAIYSKWDNPYEDEINALGSNVYLLPPPKNLLTHIKACNELLAIGQYDVIHDNSLLITYPIMRLARKRIPVRIIHSHNSKLGETAIKEKRNALFLPLLLRQANARAACSDLAAKAMFGSDDYTFIPNIIDPEKYHFDDAVRQKIRRDMNVEHKKIIATVGRVAEQKNPFFALDVFDIVAEREPTAEYWWIGSGPLDSEVADYVEKLKHGDKVRLLGSRNDMRDLYQAIDLFFLPSLFEGLPVTGVEAQAMGLPSVVSDTITKEMVYTDLVDFISLEESHEVWAKRIQSHFNRINNRRSYIEELNHSSFSSQNAGTCLEMYYRNLMD